MASDYLADKVDYFLDLDNLDGLRLLYRYAAEFDVMPPAPELQFLNPRMARP